MKSFIVVFSFIALSCLSREYPIFGLRFDTDVNANRHSITNLPSTFADDIGAARKGEVYGIAWLLWDRGMGKWWRYSVSNSMFHAEVVDTNSIPSDIVWNGWTKTNDFAEKWWVLSQCYAVSNFVISCDDFSYATNDICSLIKEAESNFNVSINSNNYVLESCFSVMTNGLASEEWVKSQDYLSGTGYATRAWVKSQGYAGIGLTNGLASREWVSSFVADSVTNVVIPVVSTNGLASESWVKSMGYLTNVTGFATEGWVVGRGYITASNLDGYARETITNGMAGSSWVSGKIASSTNALLAGIEESISLTVSNSLSGMASEWWVQNDSGMASTNWVNGSYASKDWVRENFSGISNATFATVSWVNSLGHVTAGTVNSMLSAYVTTNGLSSYLPTNHVTRTELMSAVSGLATTNYVDESVSSVNGVTPLFVTNSTSYLVGTLKSDGGYTTGQVWRVGESIVTNFFSRSGSGYYTNVVVVNVEGVGTNEVYTSYGWTRPNDWPIGTGYANVSAWRLPEAKKIKIVLLSDEYECFWVTTSGSSPVTVDWGDGFSTEYAAGSTMAHQYALDICGKNIPVVISCPDGFIKFSATKDGSTDANFPAQYSGESVSGKRVYGLEELILPLEMDDITSSYSVKGCTLLESVVSFARRCSGNYSFSSCPCLKNIVFPYLRDVSASSVFSENKGLVYAYLPSLVSLKYSGTFINCFNLRDANIKSLEYLAGNDFNYCYNLTSGIGLSHLTNNVDGVYNFNYCNFSFDTITNMCWNLPQRSNKATIYFAYNPGSVDAASWYTTGAEFTLSNRNWKVVFQ